MRRYAETFFLRPRLYLLPLAVIVLASAAVAARAVAATPPYVAAATVAVNLDPLKERPVGERPPSEYTAELLGELLRTDGFIEAALQRTSLAEKLADRGEAERLTTAVRANWRQRVGGTNTIQVSYRCDRATVCTEVMAAVLATFQDQVSASAVSTKTAAVTFYEAQIKNAEQALRTVPPSDPSWNGVRENYESLLPELIKARREEALEQQARRDDFKVIAPPTARTAAAARVVAGALPLGLGLLVGLAASVGLIVVATWLDATVRTPQDALERLGVRTIAAVPRLPQEVRDDAA